MLTGFKNIYIRNKDGSSLYIILYAFIALLLIPYVSITLNPDGIEYANIPRHYLAGDFNAAINGIWSPLLSWLLIIPRALNLDVFVYFRLLLVLLSILILWIFSVLAKKYLHSKAHEKNLIYPYAMLFMVVFCLYATILTPITPDLFSVFFTLWLLLALYNHNELPSLKNSIYLALPTAIGYYGKNYFLYFGIALTTIYFICKFATKKQSLVVLIRSFAICILTIGLIVGVWIGLMSMKYGKFTLNPIGAYTTSQVGPSYPGAPVMTLGLLKPPYEHSITAREDPSSFSYVPWSPTQSLHDLKYYIATVIPHNIGMGIAILLPVLLTLTATLLLLFHQKNTKKIWSDSHLLLLLIAALLYTGGYCLVHLEGGFRYIWPTYIMMAMLFFALVPRLAKKIRTYVLTAGLLIISIYPVTTSLADTLNNARTSVQYRHMAEQISNTHILPTDAKIASNDPYVAANICYFLSLKCYGLPKKHNPMRQLNASNIDYFMNFTTRKNIHVDGSVIFRDNKLTITKIEY